MKKAYILTDKTFYSIVYKLRIRGVYNLIKLYLRSYPSKAYNKLFYSYKIVQSNLRNKFYAFKLRKQLNNYIRF